jgi:hypothetical protein
LPSRQNFSMAKKSFKHFLIKRGFLPIWFSIISLTVSYRLTETGSQW